MTTKEQLEALPAKIAAARTAQMDAALMVPTLDLKMKQIEMQAGYQSLGGKNEFERKIQMQQILSGSDIYQQLQKEVDMHRREAMTKEIEAEQYQNELRVAEIVARTFEK